MKAKKKGGGAVWKDCCEAENNSNGKFKICNYKENCMQDKGNVENSLLASPLNIRQAQLKQKKNQLPDKKNPYSTEGVKEAIIEVPIKQHVSQPCTEI